MLLVSGIFSRMILRTSNTSVLRLNCNVLVTLESTNRTLSETMADELVVIGLPIDVLVLLMRHVEDVFGMASD